jgi:hypothetical protein
MSPASSSPASRPGSHHQPAAGVFRHARLSRGARAPMRNSTRPSRTISEQARPLTPERLGLGRWQQRPVITLPTGKPRFARKASVREDPLAASEGLEMDDLRRSAAARSAFASHLEPSKREHWRRRPAVTADATIVVRCRGRRRLVSWRGSAALVERACQALPPPSRPRGLPPVRSSCGACGRPCGRDRQRARCLAGRAHRAGFPKRRCRGPLQVGGARRPRSGARRGRSCASRVSSMTSSSSTGKLSRPTRPRIAGWSATTSRARRT